jgi:hypothetical protein
MVSESESRLFKSKRPPELKGGDAVQEKSNMR